MDADTDAKSPQHIWFIRGYAGSGKDTAARFLKEILEEMLGIPVALAAFASAVKDEVAILHDIPRHMLDTEEGKKSLHPSGRTLRDLLIEHGEGEKQRAGDLAVWAHRVIPPTGCRHWILSDWRFSAEYVALRQRFPQATLHTVRVYRPSQHVLDTYTEHELDGVPSAVTLDNSGSLLYLRRQIQNMVEEVFVPTLTV